jgi:hypothetical protein
MRAPSVIFKMEFENNGDLIDEVKPSIPVNPVYDKDGNYKACKSVEYDHWFSSRFSKMKNPGYGIS